ncbi:MAG: hypothetical protein J6125_03955 [Clostridia bacterium]|nr:hypothetical protein [Clostridia bacterium]
MEERAPRYEINARLKAEGLRFWCAESAPFAICGLMKEGGKFRRMPEAVARTVSPAVLALHANTAGGRVRFVTDSRRIAIHAEMENVARFAHFSLSGSAGFDAYRDGVFAGPFLPPYDLTDGYESLLELPGAGPAEITLHFPLYADVCGLWIGLDEGAAVEAAAPYRHDLPVVYYGSSITQGACASRPGMAYQSILARERGLDYINLGFSGSAKAEDEMIDYIKGLRMRAFVLDYDYNAPDPAYLARTHGRAYDAVRRAQPELPIILMNRPRFCLSEEDRARRAVIEETYERAVRAGDKRVRYVDNRALTRLCGADGSVDNVHPTDLGFVSMARALGEAMDELGI